MIRLSFLSVLRQGHRIKQQIVESENALRFSTNQLRVPFLLTTFLAFEALSQSSELRMRLNTPRFNNAARQDLAALILKTYSCVKAVDKIEDQLVEVEFSRKDCFIYEAAKSAVGLKDAFLPLRDAWQKNYVSHAHEMNLGFQVPGTLEAFKVLTDYSAWPSEVIQSELKEGPRTIYRNKSFMGHDIRVSEMAIVAEENKIEVEVAISLGDDRVFLVYSTAGKLVSQAHFPRGPLLAPMSCTGCHYDADTRTVSKNF